MGKWTRRAFIGAGVTAGGALVVGVALRPGKRHQELADLVARDGADLVNAWVKISPENHVTAIVPHSEMGQGAQTALTQMLADELDARWEDVSFEEAPAEDAYANWALGKGFILGDAELPKALVPTVDGAFMAVAKAMHLQITGGSMSVRTTGVYGMRVAGAAAREMLVAAAAAAWKVPADEITARESHLLHERTGRSAPFARFAAAAGERTPPRSPRLKTPDEFRIMGRSVPRRDIPAKVDGSLAFGIDADVPGMKHAAILGAPVFGARVAKLDASRANAMSGVVDVVNLDDAVAVVADGWWQAQQALKQVTVEWTETGHEDLDSKAIFARFDRDLDAARTSGGTTADVERGDLAAAFGEAAQTVEANYRVPWLAHSCMEPMNATARVDGERCEIWVGCQNPLGYRYEVAAALGIDVEQVTLHQHMMGGGFGRRSTADVPIQAARLSRAVGMPVKLIWSREEDIRHDIYRPAVASKFRAGLNEAGEVLAWENVYHEKHEPAEAPVIPYAIAAQHIHHTDSPTHVPFGPWRSVDHSQHGFFTESFIDEVAHAAGRDPYEYRRALLADAPRKRAVLDLAAEKAGWGEALGPNRGRGIALQESFGTIVAQVVDVTVTEGRLKVDRVVCAVDCGFAVSPDGLAAQMESGTIYGLSAALHGNIEIENGAVKQSNFHDYPAVRMDEAPLIETHVLNSGEAWGGAGEPGTPGIAPALANAVFQATGLRIRELPFSLHDLRTPIETDEVGMTG
ncbi:MAG: molybdopterin cofactor-binding domain-containing protein [Pseudomonadales bacterium]|jgi:isoquinoline 1-oxidoreductase beta subunit|nr:molybdopterin cofactor-binding domain-containing protein [Pseudomonadales bacterium]